MKHWLLLICFTFLGNVLFAQKGLQFRDLTLSEALAKAKEENKLVFMEIHTDGCGACELMKAEVFPRSEMGEYFNDRFICVSYNTSRPENKYIRERFPTYYVPSFFLLDAGGNVKHKFVGAAVSNAFIALVREAMESKIPFDCLEERYRSGKIEKTELIDYYKIVSSFGDKKVATEVLQKLKPMLTLQDSLTPCFYVLIDNISQPANRAFFYRNLDALCKSLGKEWVERLLREDWHSRIKKCIPIFDDNKQPDFSSVKEELEKENLECKSLLLDEIVMLNAFFSKDISRGLELLHRIVNIKGCDPYFLSIAVNQTRQHGSLRELETIRSLKQSILNHCEQTFFARNLRKVFDSLEQKWK